MQEPFTIHDLGYVGQLLILAVLRQLDGGEGLRGCGVLFIPQTYQSFRPRGL